jgi:molybdenum cofactor cytidylyltransferase
MHPLILLAAGDSTRMGGPKGLLPFGNRTWIEEQLDAIRSAGVTRILLVLGRDSDAYFQKLHWLKGSPDIETLVNPDPDRGAFSSLQLALEKIQGQPVFVLPIDVPAASPETWRTLALRAESSVFDDGSLPLFCARPVDSKTKTRGHPVLLSAVFAEQLVQVDLDGDQARLDLQIRSLNPECVHDIPVDDPVITLNLNTPEEFTAFAKSRARPRPA